MGTGDGYFRKGTTYQTGSRSFSGVTEDFNADGHLDIALAVNSSGASSIRLYMGNGDGTFQQPKRLAKTLAPLVVVASDMNGDGKTDLVFASGQGDNLYLLYSNGDGSFKDPIAFSGGGGPFALTTGHFDPDKLKDVAVANSRSSTFSIVIRNRNETFKYPTRDYVVAGGTVLAITSGDYNHVEGGASIDPSFTKRSWGDLKTIAGCQTFSRRNELLLSQVQRHAGYCYLSSRLVGGFWMPTCWKILPITPMKFACSCSRILAFFFS